MMRNDSPKIRCLSLHINEKIQKNQPVDSGRAPCTLGTEYLHTIIFEH